MSKVVLMLCFLAILAVAISSIDAMHLEQQLENAGMLSRQKRGPICWPDMVAQCCGAAGCNRPGCRYAMCSICC